MVAAAWASSNPVAISRPSGLTVGDLMVLCTTSYGGLTSDYPSGWTPLGVSELVVSGDSVRACWKTADSGDVAASTFGMPNANGKMSMGMCWAIQDAGTIEFSVVAKGSAANPTMLNSGFTPNVTGDLLLAFGGSELAMGAFSTANNNPSWIEDVSRTNYCVAKGRHATFGIGATGNVSCAISDTDGKAAFVFVALAPAGGGGGGGTLPIRSIGSGIGSGIASGIG